jgi:hypothetical protein
MAATFNYGASPTYVKIGTQTATSDVASITFSNIPQGYTDLQLIANVRGATHLYCRINENSSTIYSLTGIYFRRNGANSADESGSERNTGQSYLKLTPFTYLPNASLTFGTINANFMSYSNSSIFKTVLSNAGGEQVGAGAYTGVEQSVNIWRSTSPITSLTFTIQSGNILSGSTFTLYGIEAAVSPKATGGDIVVRDSQYWYHIFNQSGTLFTRTAITTDYLVVAGGGGGGGTHGGGGGGGGFRTASSISLTAQSPYTVIVGAGGVAGVGNADTTGSQGSNSSFSGSGITTTTSAGGGAGAGGNSVGGNGGSGGGASGVSGSFAPGSGNTPSTSPSQGNNGGSGRSAAGGGGGGAGAVGTSSAVDGRGGAGGNGSASSLSGSSVTYAGGGGGGGIDNATVATGGTGGGGAGTNNGLARGTAGTANLGGGGGGGGYTNTPLSRSDGGNGGSGVVIVRYPI